MKFAPDTRTLERINRSLFEIAEDKKRDFLEAGYNALISLRKKCESPIELLLAGYIFGRTDGYNDLEYCPDFPCPIKPQFATQWTPQVQVGKYCADFLFKTFYENWSRVLVVECDGHDFHERTKEQAAKDKSRDRWFGDQRIEVMRFTGSEIHKDPKDCVDQIENRLAYLVDEVLVEAGVCQPVNRQRVI